MTAPETSTDGTSTTQACQLLGAALLAEFSRVCTEVGAGYFLDAGTLLGAVRHEGFIPWDDDVDVIMHRAEFEKLRDGYSQVRTRLPIAIVDPLVGPGSTVVPRFQLVGSRVVWEDTIGFDQPERTRFCVDILILDRGPADPRLVKGWLVINRILQVAIAFRGTSWTTVRLTPAGSSRRVLHQGLWAASRLCSARRLKAGYRALATRFSAAADGDLFALNHLSWARNTALKPEWFATSRVRFEGMEHPAPEAGPYLSALYGEDYLQPPSEANRSSHNCRYVRAQLGGTLVEAGVAPD